MPGHLRHLVSKESCPPASHIKLCVKSHSQTRTAGSDTQQTCTYLPKALSPPSPHPPLGEDEKRGGEEGRGR